MDGLRVAFGEHEDAWEHFARGYELQMQGRLRDALAAYRQSLALHPTAEAMTFYGWALSFMGRVEDAIEACHKAIAIDPDFGNPYNDIGAYLLQLGRPLEAIPWLEKAKQAPRYESRQFPWCNLGAAYEALGRLPEAMEQYRGALAIEPDYDHARHRLFQLLGRIN